MDENNEKTYQNEIINQLLYQQWVDEELEWRKKTENNEDVKTLDNMLAEINILGYNYKYETDITFFKINDKRILDIVKKYIGKFNDPGVNAEFVGTIGQKGNDSALETIINAFNNISAKRNYKHAVFYDNAITKIADKHYIKQYIEWLKDPLCANALPLIMEMLGRWKNEEAKKLFLNYLDLSREDQIVFTSIRALSYYKDPEVYDKIKEMLKHKNKEISKFAEKILIKMSKNL